MATFSTTNKGTKAVLSSGNSTLTSTSGTGQAIAAIDMVYTSGTLYAQFLINSMGAGTNHRIGFGIGITGTDFNKAMGGTAQVWAYIDAPDLVVNGENFRIHNGSYNEPWGVAVTAGDYIGVYYDLDNGFIYIDRNGTMMNSGDPGSGSAGTGALYSFPTGQANYYFMAMTNNQGTTSSITLVSPSTGGPGYGYTEV